MLTRREFVSSLTALAPPPHIAIQSDRAVQEIEEGSQSALKRKQVLEATH